MLLLAAALFTASVHSSGVTGDTTVRAIPAQVTHAVVASGSTATARGGVASNRTAPAENGDGSARTGVAPARTAPGATDVDAAHRPSRRAPVTEPTGRAPWTEQRLARANGAALLRGLAAARPATLHAADRADSVVLRRVLGTPPSSAEVATWWSGLDREDRHRLTADVPRVVGNLDGLPYDVRDRANRTALAADLRAAVRPASPTAGDLRVLDSVRTALVRGPQDPPKQLVVFDPRSGGRAAVAMGDLDTATDVTVMVPGMFFTVGGQFVDWTATGADLYREQATLASVARPDHGLAVVSWLGYRTPDLTDVLSLAPARAGATRLERFLSGIDTARAAHPARVSVVAHSYGSTTAMMALSSGRAHADSLTVLGSPGSGVARASDLAVPAGEVFVGAAPWDPVAGTGYFGTDPGAAGFGSRVLDLAGGADLRNDGDVLRRPAGHNGYLVPGTASIHDVALIALGRPDLAVGTAARPVLASAVGSGTPGRPGGTGGDDPGTPQFLIARPQDLQLRD